MQKKETKQIIKPPQSQITSKATTKPSTNSISSSSKTTAVKPNLSDKSSQQSSASQTSLQKASITQPKVAQKPAQNTAKLSKIVEVNISFTRAIQLKKSMKEIEDIPKINAEKIRLVLDTQFNDDRDLQNFAQGLMKIANRVNVLSWKLKAKSIAEAIGSFTQAYRIDLNIDDIAFSGTSDSTFSANIKKLQNLHEIRLKLNVYNSNTSSQSDGISKIGQAISSLQKLEYLSYDKFNWIENKIPNNLSNYVCQVDYSFENCEHLKDTIKDFKEKIQQRSSKLTEISLENKPINFKDFKAKGYCCCCEIEQMDPKTYIEILYEIKLIIKDLPYLTCFKQSFDFYFGSEEDNKHLQKQMQILQEFEKIIKTIGSERLFRITQISAFKNHILQSLPINPTMVLIDLYID